ncbi:MAG TPA: magnesium chelatase domain-containing protein, partial [Longimicrobium sp.]|nr:magnesium chelatase domain-containing protein [Longimicrobium sp.]
MSISNALELVGHSRLGRDTFDRVDAALRACGHPLPDARYVLNLGNAGVLPGHHRDLPAAVAAVSTAGELGADRLNAYLLAGELALDGTLRPVRGAILLACAAKQLGLPGIILPAANAGEAAVVDGLDVRGA